MKFHHRFIVQRIKPNVILDIVAQCFMVSVSEITGNDRKEPIVTARHLAIYFIYENCNMFKIAIGRMFNRDHTSVIHAINNVKKFNDTDEKYKQIFLSIYYLINEKITHDNS